MALERKEIVDQLLENLADADGLARFLDSPLEVIEEVADGPLDAQRLEAILSDISDREQSDGISELSDEQLDEIVGAIQVTIALNATAFAATAPVRRSLSNFNNVMTFTFSG